MNDYDFDKERKQLMDLMKNTDNFFKDFGRVDDDAFSEGAIPKKYKELAMVAVSIVSKCEECIEYHIKECLKVNSSAPEIIDTIKMGMMAGGSLSYPYVRHSFKMLKKLKIIN
ncbi:MAG: carboxymuconolactone decarboxylase family protein [Promethearchaeota archaeon]